MCVNEICPLDICSRQHGTEILLNMVQVETDNLQIWENSGSVKCNTHFKTLSLISNKGISAVVWGFANTYLQKFREVKEKEKERVILFT